MDKVLPKRKSTRLKDYDYSSAGAYFVTICVRDRKPILSEIIRTNFIGVDKTVNSMVGEGLAPPDFGGYDISEKTEAMPSYCGMKISALEDEHIHYDYSVYLKPCGEVAKEQLHQIENRFQNVSVEDFVIMPDHIHATIFLREKAGGASPSPTLNDVVCAFKSLTTRICKQKLGVEKLFQRSYAEHIIRDMADYETRRRYIYENPVRWIHSSKLTK